MRGAVAAGSTGTARAGIDVLRAGGNAVDAAVAACFATAAAEPVLTSLAGGGVLLHRDGQSGEMEACDFFANAPGIGGSAPAQLDFFDVEIDFGPATQQFHVGRGAAAVPGVIPGLCAAHDRWGKLSLQDVVAPACQQLRAGTPLEPWQAYTVELLRPILLNTEAGRQQYCVHGKLLCEGDLVRNPALAGLLERLARGPWRQVYGQEVETPVVRQFGAEAGGLLTSADLAAYEVAFRQPLALEYAGSKIYTNPPPAMGARMIALMLRLLDCDELRRLDPGSAERIHALCRAMQVADEARAAGELDGVAPGGQGWLERFLQLGDQPLAEAPRGPGGPGSTTHVSVIDAEGNAAAVTFSFGEGCGTLIEGSGIMMNNLMGEEDLFPGGFHNWSAGERLSTMMSPTIVVSPDGAVIALGSGGSNRIRTALTQVICSLLGQRWPARRAVEAARVHFEGGVLSAEVFESPDQGRVLQQLGAQRVVLFDQPNLFFGGVHMVRRGADGSLEGAGDPRRGGAYLES